MKYAALLLILSVSLCGCETFGPSRAIRQYYEAAPQVKVGDSRDEALAILLPTQDGLAAWERKPAESYREDGRLVEITYFRTGWQEDGLVTDDEFVPYVFTDGTLTSIGWKALGGPKTVGQVVQPAPVTNIEINEDDN